MLPRSICQYYIAFSVILYTGDKMDTKPLKVKISITLDEPVYEKIKDLADYDDRPVSSYINLVLRRYLERLEKKQMEKNQK